MVVRNTHACNYNRVIVADELPFLQVESVFFLDFAT